MSSSASPDRRADTPSWPARRGFGYPRVAMHETSLAQELLEIAERVARENGAGRILSATLELGELTCVDPETLELAFEVVARGTLAEGCELALRRVPLLVSCPACGREGPAEPELLGCPGCGAPVRVLAGREMRVVSIEVEEVGHA